MYTGRIVLVGVAIGLVVGAGGTALGFELTEGGSSGQSCAAAHHQLRQVHAMALSQIGAGAAHANSVREAALVLAYPRCFSTAENTAAYNQMQDQVRLG